MLSLFSVDDALQSDSLISIRDNLSDAYRAILSILHLVNNDVLQKLKYVKSVISDCVRHITCNGQIGKVDRLNLDFAVSDLVHASNLLKLQYFN